MRPLAFVWLLVVAWLPGAVLFRAPAADRPARARLPAEERVFWSIVLSLALSLGVTLLLASAGQYTFERLLVANLLVTLAVAGASRFRLTFGGAARRPDAGALIPVALALAGAWHFLPPAEYVMGGRDPGTYVSEGIQIAQRGALLIEDEVVASVPPAVRDLFFPSHQNPNYYSLRFMGFFVRDPDAGLVVGQFPHLFPASIAIGYGLDGLTGARRVVPFWATLGLVAVYLAGARLAGRAAAAAAAALLSGHVLQVWYARYPSSEIVQQALLFAALLAADRAIVERDRFFGAVAGVLLGLQMWLRVDVILGVAAVAAAAVLNRLRTAWTPWTLVVPLGILMVAAGAYLVTLMSGYAYYPLEFTRNWVLVPALAAGSAGMLALVWIGRRPARVEKLERWLPAAIAGAATVAVVYAWSVRRAGGRLAAHDADALRTFAAFYLTVPGLIAATAGFAYLVTRHFWRAPALLGALAVYAGFFFYKIRVVPEHFWMGRRFLAVVLPGALLCLAALALANTRARSRLRQTAGLLLGAAFLGLLGSNFARAAAPVARHVEYAGLIPRLETLAGRFGDRDLVVVESRDASDLHVLALPLAYIYARNVLVLSNPVPDKAAFALFLDWARSRYDRVLFLGGGGTDLLARAWSVEPVASDQFRVPEYETTPWHVFPRLVRQKEFEYGIYAFGPPRPGDAAPFDLDVGARDDLHVVRFHSREQSDGRTMRWTLPTSYVTVPIHPGVRRITLWMSDGGRPAGAPPAQVAVHLGAHHLGTAAVDTGFEPYAFDVPPAAAAGAGEEPVRLRLVSTVWNPHERLGTGDDRTLGVMVDRVRVE